MHRILTAMAMAIAILVLMIVPASAITFGEPDGDAHPNVGALIWERQPGVMRILCSGTLIGPKVFLTAGHCTSFLASRGVTDVWVTFDSMTDDPIGPGTELIHGRYVTHPEFGFSGPDGFSDPHDLAVVLLDKKASAVYRGIEPASLPTEGLFDAMGPRGLRGQLFTAVGYGVHAPEVGGGPPEFPFDGDRWRSVSEFWALENVWLHLSQNDATSDGGTCFGDSGGPNFLGAGGGETDIIAGITVTGDAMCLATNVIYRLDTASARAFLDDLVALP